MLAVLVDVRNSIGDLQTGQANMSTLDWKMGPNDSKYITAKFRNVVSTVLSVHAVVMVMMTMIMVSCFYSYTVVVIS